LRLVLDRAAAVILPLEDRGNWEVEEEEEEMDWGRSGDALSAAMVPAAGGGGRDTSDGISDGCGVCVWTVVELRFGLLKSFFSG
jgi:hypothetical protein